jgi:hypothetical protein
MMFGLTPGETIAIASIAIAIGSLTVAGFSLLSQRTHNRLSVRPAPSIHLSDYSDRLLIDFSNFGSGPLFVEKCEVALGENIYPMGSSGLPGLISFGTKISHFKSVKFVTVYPEMVLAPGSTVSILDLEFNQSDDSYSTQHAMLRNSLSRMEIRIYFTDLYFSRYVPYKKSLAWFGRHA